MMVLVVVLLTKECNKLAQLSLVKYGTVRDIYYGKLNIKTIFKLI
jgi:hypothetical protein